MSVKFTFTLKQEVCNVKQPSFTFWAPFAQIGVGNACHFGICTTGAIATAFAGIVGSGRNPKSTSWARLAPIVPSLCFLGHQLMVGKITQRTLAANFYVLFD